VNFIGAIVFCLIGLYPSLVVFASDLDDGISKYTDDRITKYDDLGKKIPNKAFITVKAKSKGHKKGAKSFVSGKGGNGGVGNVNIGAGTVVKGDIIVVQTIKDATVVSGK